MLDYIDPGITPIIDLSMIALPDDHTFRLLKPPPDPFLTEGLATFFSLFLHGCAW